MILLSRDSFHSAILNKKNPLSAFIKQRFKSWEVMFFGSDDFSLQSLEALNSCLEKKIIKKLEIVSLNTESLTYKYAAKKNLKHHVWPPKLTEYFDIGIVVSFGKLIPKAIIDHFPLGILNVHASLLPQYRGPMPIYHALKNGESETGVTIMKIKPFKFDTGDIVMQEKYYIGCDELMPEVKRRMAVLGAKCLVKAINGLPKVLENSVPQHCEKSSTAPKIKKEAAIVQWDKSTAAEIYNLYRGLFGIYALRTTWNSLDVLLVCISPYLKANSQELDNVNKLTPGSIEYSKVTRRLKVHCVDKPLFVCSLFFKNKLFVAHDFYRGYLARTSKDKWIFV